MIFSYIGLGSGFNVSGRIDSGHVQVGESVLILPAQEIATIKCRYLEMCLLVGVFIYAALWDIQS